MNSIPLTVLDDFFPNPKTIKDWALTLSYTSDPEYKWPGKRTDNLSQIHPVFYAYVCRKVLSLFFTDAKELNFEVDLRFQLIENQPGKGWIHQDPTIFTFLIYLHENNPKINCGTALWSLKPNLVSSINSKEDVLLENKRYKDHKDKLLDSPYQSEQAKKYIPEISIPDKFNRLLAFSSEQHHSSNYYDNNLSPRLTLIGFVKNIHDCRLPVLRSKQIPLV